VPDAGLAELAAVQRAEQPPRRARGPALVAAARGADFQPAGQRVLRVGVQADRPRLVALGAARADYRPAVVELVDCG
jgi:hypothetical protein